MQLVLQATGELQHKLLSKNTKLLSSLTVFNKVTRTKLVTQESYFYTTQEKKVTSKLHKSTNYKSNYTSTIYER
jgi:hypothetical protein